MWDFDMHHNLQKPNKNMHTIGLLVISYTPNCFLPLTPVCCSQSHSHDFLMPPCTHQLDFETQAIHYLPHTHFQDLVWIHVQSLQASEGHHFPNLQTTRVITQRVWKCSGGGVAGTKIPHPLVQSRLLHLPRVPVDMSIKLILGSG
jgi:hypothetical protein